MNADQFKEFRKSKRWSQVKIADELGVIQQAVSKWESGKRSIPKYIEKLIECLKKK